MTQNQSKPLIFIQTAQKLLLYVVEYNKNHAFLNKFERMCLILNF